MNMFTFLFYTILGSLIWNIVLIILGSILGNNWTKILQILDTYTNIVIIVLIVIIIIFIIWLFKRNKKNK